MRAYAQSKLANIYFAAALERRIKKEKLQGISVSLHPGVIYTEGMRDMPKSYKILLYLLRYLTYPFAIALTKTIKSGAQTTLHCVH